MLVFNPKSRIRAGDALAHDYLAPYHDPTDEPVAEEMFDWSFNDADLPVDTWKIMMYVPGLIPSAASNCTCTGIRRFSTSTTSIREPTRARFWWRESVVTNRHLHRTTTISRITHIEGREQQYALDNLRMEHSHSLRRVLGWCGSMPIRNKLTYDSES